MRLLHFIPRLDQNGAGRQLAMIASAMHENGAQVEVCQFAAPSAESERLERAGIVVHSLPSKRWINPGYIFEMHRLLGRFQPNLIHVWHRPVLRTLAMISPKSIGRVVLSRPFVWDRTGRVSALDRWLLNRVARIVVQDPAEALVGKKLGLFLDKLVVIPPGIDDGLVVSRNASGGIGQKIVCVGPIERHKGFGDAVWTFDMLRYIFPDLQLVIVGDGPDRPRLQRLADDLECRSAVHFVGLQDDVAGYLAQADVCWIPSQTGGGTQTTLEAMLQARPIVACRVPSLHGLIVDDDSGFTIVPGDKVSLANRTRRILLDRDLGERLGNQARRRVLEHFPAKRFAEQYQRTYADCISEQSGAVLAELRRAQ